MAENGTTRTRKGELGTRNRRANPCVCSVPRSAFRLPRYVAPMPVQAIAWSPSGAVRIIDQRALPETKIERDLETGGAVADAIRTLQGRGARVHVISEA